MYQSDRAQCAPMADEHSPGPDFIRQAVADDVAAGKNGGRVQTRFPPEPNGYLHIGHAKAICINFGIAADFGGHCFLRFDDTNPVKEDAEYVDAIMKDVRWLGFDWQDRLRHASDHFDRLYEFALNLIDQRKAYVDSQTAEEIRENRGTLKEPGRNSPYRDRSVEENRSLFEAMARGELDEGSAVLRARIDMASPNINLRDPTLYRIRKVEHQRTGDKWCIYPMYDFAHTLSDALEGTTHSLCSLEFEDHRPLYEWFLEQLPVPHHPRQIEFSRFNLMFTVMSKRILKRLVDDGIVDGWDDPRMPTLAAFRRRGYTPESIRDFMSRVGVTRKENTIQLGMLEYSIREDLNDRAERRFAVLRPLKLIIENYPADREEWLEAANHPNRPELGTRTVPFCRELYIERDDFMEDPPRKFFRLRPGGEVRLRYAYIIRCERIVKDDDGNVTEVICSHDPATRSGTGPDAERKVKGTIHWVSARHGLRAEVRLYDRLFRLPDPMLAESVEAALNPDSLEIIEDAVLEPTLEHAKLSDKYQFERTGYFCPDPVDSLPGRPVFNRTVTLRDGWAKIEAQAAAESDAG
ncbi:MAG: glutamine--tRNA ligase/YqeY domain fusion protein [Gammaproteobacteria bacterium]|jgi:glutaminyl-tRNA synthetase